MEEYFFNCDRPGIIKRNNYRSWMTKQYLIDWIRHITLTNSNRLYRIEFKICGHLIWNRLYEIYISIFSLSAFCLQIVFSTVQVRHTYMYKRILKSSEVFFFLCFRIGVEICFEGGKAGKFWQHLNVA